MDLIDAIDVTRVTDVGIVREHNEDVVASDMSIGLVMLADGMGGYKAGDIASEIATLTVTADISEALAVKTAKKRSIASDKQLLKDAVIHANQVIYDIAQQRDDCEGMGTTLVMGLFVNNKVIVGHVGDSRMYRFRDQTLTQLTEDHSLVQEQLNAGKITEKEAEQSKNGHLVTRALGADNTVECDVAAFDAHVHDIYLLCSDGLTDLIPDDEIQKMFTLTGVDIELAARGLIRLANEQGGRDNVSVVIARIKKPFPYTGSWLKKFLRLER